jgi:hypothetical protein
MLRGMDAEQFMIRQTEDFGLRKRGLPFAIVCALCGKEITWGGSPEILQNEVGQEDMRRHRIGCPDRK